MFGFLFVFIASFFASTASLVTAKTVRHQGESAGYFTFYFLVSFFAVFLINLFSFEKVAISVPLFVIGSVAGFLLITSMILVGIGVQKGPSGLTFAFLNSGAAMPPLVLAFLFSTPFGFSLNIFNVIGITMVVCGLFWGALRTKISLSSKDWILYATAAFLIQTLILTIFQWRALLLQEGIPAHTLIPCHCEPHEDFCFMPMMFFIAFSLQALLFIIRKKRKPTKWEIVGGSLGGIANGLSTVLLLLATLKATDVEKPMLFPLFAALVILLCSFFERLFHKEKVNWVALSLLAFGIFIGMFFKH